MGRSSFDWKKIARDYAGGMSLPQLSRKYGISVSHASAILRKAGVRVRGPLDRQRKLVRVGRQRLVSLPYELLRELGYSKEEDLWYHWEPRGRRMVLHISRRPDEYRMYRMGATRIVRFKTDEKGEMRGRWVLENGRLALEITWVSESSFSS